MKSIYRSLAVIASLVLATGCVNIPQLGQTANPDAYSAAQAMGLGLVKEAVVLQVRDVTIRSTSGIQTAGAATGGLFGALAGKNTSSSNQTMIALLGAGVGALAGNQLGQTKATEVVVMFGDLTKTVIVQKKDDIPVKAKDLVLVLINGPEVRIVRNYN